MNTFATKSRAIIVPMALTAALVLAPPAGASAATPVDDPELVDCQYDLAMWQERGEHAEAQLLIHAGMFASLRWEVDGLRVEVEEQRREAARAWQAEERQRRVADRYFARIVKLKAEVTLLRVRLGLPVQHERPKD